MISLKKNISVVGNIVVDFIATPIKNIPHWGELYNVEYPIGMNIGGNGAIAAVCAARLGLVPYLVGCVGDDIIGKRIIDMLKAEKVRTDFIKQINGQSTGTTLALARKDGERMFFHHMGSNTRLVNKHIHNIFLDDFSALLVSSVFILPGLKPEGLMTTFKNARRSGIPTIIDVAWDPTGKWKFGNIFAGADYFLPNEVEIQHIARSRTTRKAVERLHDRGVQNIVVKQGKKGCTVYVKGRPPKRVSAPAIKPVDTTGAGDAFNAGFIKGLLKYDDVYEASKYATATASLSVTGIGGTARAPTVKDVERVMQSQEEY